MIKDEYLEVDGKILTNGKKVRTVRRIQEWEKFEENCLRLKELERRKTMNFQYKDEGRRTNTKKESG